MATQLAPTGAEVPARQTTEVSASAVAAQAKAQVEARYLMALQRPRNWTDVRNDLLDTCKRPRFAAAAKYAKPIGRDEPLVGPSIRFAEEVARCMGNLLIETVFVSEDDERRIMRVVVTDLERNLSYPGDVVVNKVVPRSKVRDGQILVRAQENSKGARTYYVRASEDEQRNSTQSEASRIIRNNVLRICPQDIIEEALDVVESALSGEFKNDREAAIRRIAQLFHGRGVSGREIEDYLGHSLAQMNETERDRLQSFYNAIKEGESTWSALTAKDEKAADAKPNGNGGTAKTGTEGLKARVAEATPQAAAAPSGSADPAPPPSQESDEDLRQQDLELVEEEKRRGGKR